jgi:hypothetical protein
MTAMRYQCASCGETNEVLPPKGYAVTKHSEAKSHTQKSAMREAVQRLSKKLAKKEARFVSNNKRVRSLMQENISLRAKLAARNRADKAAAMLREARIPADVLSAAELVTFDPIQWGTQIKIARRTMSRESFIPGGATPRTGGGQNGNQAGGAKVAKQTFDQAYNQE